MTRSNQRIEGSGHERGKKNKSINEGDGGRFIIHRLTRNNAKTRKGKDKIIPADSQRLTNLWGQFKRKLVPFPTWINGIQAEVNLTK